MNELTVIDDQHMTSVQIAELTGKKHQHVMRDIRTLIDQGAINESNFGRISYTDPMNRKQDAFSLDFQATMVLITGYDAVKRAAVVSRWTKLERRIQQPETAPLNLDDPSFLRQALLTYTEKVIELEATVAEQQPKVEALERIACSDGLMCITDAAKTLGIRPKDLFAWMSARKWIYKRAGNSSWIAYQNRLQQGLLEHKINMVRYTDGSEQMRERAMVTAKGLARISEAFSNHDS